MAACHKRSATRRVTHHMASVKRLTRVSRPRRCTMSMPQPHASTRTAPIIKAARIPRLMRTAHTLDRSRASRRSDQILDRVSRDAYGERQRDDDEDGPAPHRADHPEHPQDTIATDGAVLTTRPDGRSNAGNGRRNRTRRPQPDRPLI